MAKPTYGQLLTRYRARYGKLVIPKQGASSLHPSLGLAYSMSIKRSFYDVGTYARKPGDHSWGDRNGRPGMALAFDIRRRYWLGRFGWAWRYAKKWAQYLWDNHEALNIEYVIIGSQVISRSKPYWHPLSNQSDTSHYWHIHVSGSGWPDEDL
jgi:hypothetical protein